VQLLLLLREHAIEVEEDREEREEEEEARRNADVPAEGDDVGDGEIKDGLPVVTARRCKSDDAAPPTTMLLFACTCLSLPQQIINLTIWYSPNFPQAISVVAPAAAPTAS
jgi:hypothetical protein